MDITETDEEVVLTMSHAEWAQLRNSFNMTWHWILGSVKNNIPSGRVFGMKPIDEVWSGNELKAGIVENLAREELKGIEAEPTCVTPELLERISKLENEPSQLLERIERLEDQTQFETSEDAARIKVLELKVNEIQECELTADRRFGRLELRTSKLETEGHLCEHGAVTRLAERIMKLEQIVTEDDRVASAHKRITSETHRLNEIRAQLHEIQDRLDTYGVPVVARLDPESEVVSYDEAERRIREYMSGYWSDSSVQDVVAALRGVVRAENDESDKVTDHAFRYSVSDRLHCSYRSDSEDEKCGKFKDQHKHYQAQPIRVNKLM
jgi:DNA repair exonuclease SbcCD ATPase subunit